MALLGPSGSGKSTAACAFSRGGLLQKPTDGEVRVDGKRLDGAQPVGSRWCFQSYALLPWLTVFENVALEAEEPTRSAAARAAHAHVKRAIDIVGLEGFEEAYPKRALGRHEASVLASQGRSSWSGRSCASMSRFSAQADVLSAETLRSEILNIWLSKKTQTKSMVLVTHNITEAAAFAKRILVMGTNPGHVRVVIKNDLPYPRDERSSGFKSLVNNIHDVITQAIDPRRAGAGGAARPWQASPIETLPHVPLNEVIGLVEFVAARGGQVDSFAMSGELGKDFGQILFLAKAAELLDFVDTPKNAIVLTDFGRRFIQGDVNVRKRKSLHEALRALKLSQLLEAKLREADHYTLPFETVLEHTHEWLPSENATAILDTLIQAGADMASSSATTTTRKKSTSTSARKMRNLSMNGEHSNVADLWPAKVF